MITRNGSHVQITDEDLAAERLMDYTCGATHVAIIGSRIQGRCSTEFIGDGWCEWFQVGDEIQRWEEGLIYHTMFVEDFPADPPLIKGPLGTNDWRAVLA